MILLAIITYIVITAPLLWCGYTGHSYVYHFKDKYNNQCVKCQNNYINSQDETQ